MDSEAQVFLKTIRIRSAATTFYRKKYLLRAFLNYLAGEKRSYQTIQKEDIEKYLLSRSCSSQSRQAHLCVIREFYDYLISKELVFENPACDIIIEKQNRQRLFNVPDSSHVKRIYAHLAHVYDEHGLRNRALLELAYGSALRRSELIKLNVEDMDFSNRILYVQGKWNKKRMAPVTSKAIHALREYLKYTGKSRGPLFLSKDGRRLAVGSLNWIFKNKMGTRPHYLRHACAVHMLKNGANTRVLQELLGHSSLATTQIYTHLNKEDLAHIIDKIHPRKILTL